MAVAAFAATAPLYALVVEPPFRFMTYNIRHGQGLDGTLDLRRTAEVIKAQRPQFVALQEVDQMTTRVAGTNTCELLAKLCGLHATFAKAMDYQGGEYGNALLSREAPLSVRRQPLPGEPRVLLLCEFADCWVGSMHLDLETDERESAVPLVRQALEGCGDKPVFAMGDWNATPDSATLARLKEFLTVLSPQGRPTVQSGRNCIDYIAVDLAHGSRIHAGGGRVVQGTEASDHKPVTVDVWRPNLPGATAELVGTPEKGADFASAQLALTVRIARYATGVRAAKVTVRLVPAEDGETVARSFTIGGDVEPHDVTQTFDGLTAGVRYRVVTEVEMGGEKADLACGSFVAAQEADWFAETANGFPNRNWKMVGAEAAAVDGEIRMLCAKDGEVAYEPEKTEQGRAKVFIRGRLYGRFTTDEPDPPEGKAGISSVMEKGGRPQLAVWGNGRWNRTGVELGGDDDASSDMAVEVELDRPERTVSYRLASADGTSLGLGCYAMSSGSDAPVERVCFTGRADIRELNGTRQNANCIADAAGREFADCAAARRMGAQEPLSPLWRTMVTLSDQPGTLTVCDPLGWMTFGGAGRVLLRESGADGADKIWYGKPSDVHVRDLTCADGDGTLAFRVAIGEQTVDSEAVKGLVEVSAEPSGPWRTPSEEDVIFREGTLEVTPNRGERRGFVRVGAEKP